MPQLRIIVSNYVFDAEDSNLDALSKEELVGMFLQQKFIFETPEQIMSDILTNYVDNRTRNKIAKLVGFTGKASIGEIAKALKTGVTAPLAPERKKIPTKKKVPVSKKKVLPKLITSRKPREVKHPKKAKQRILKKISKTTSQEEQPVVIDFVPSEPAFPTATQPADKEEQIYLPHVIEYLSRKYTYIGDDLVEQPGQSVKAFAQERGISAAKFTKYFKILKEEAEPHALRVIRDREESRLATLRAEIEPAAEPIKSQEVALLEQLAELPLPDLAKLSPKDEDMWLRIAEDVNQVGLADVVAGKYLRELGIPQSIPANDAIRIALRLIENRLKQIGLFNPPNVVSFAALRDYIELPIKPKPSPKPTPPVASLHESEDELLKELEQVEREELELLARSAVYLDTPEERQKRRMSGWALEANLFSREETEELRLEGAIFDRGEWLLPSTESHRAWRSRKAASQVWPHQRKPKLLIVGGKETYPKRWMHEEFELRAIHQPTKSFDRLVEAFEPDAMFTYLQATARPLLTAASTYSSRTGVPLIRFHKGFSDAVEDARRQGLTWFVDAFFRNTRHNPRALRRRLPTATSQIRRYFGPRFKY